MTWEVLSDELVLVSAIILCFALLAHAGENALRVRSRRAAVPAKVAAGAAGSETPTSDSPTPADGWAPWERWERAATALTTTAVAVLLVAVAARGVAAGRAPWATMYEFAVTGALSVGIAHLAFRRRRRVDGLGLWVSALLLLTLGLALAVLYSPADDIVPVLDSAWLVVHVSAAIIAGGLFTIGFVATTMLLVRSRSGRRRLPESVTEGNERIAHTAHLVAFPIWTFAVLAGAIWAENAWGRYWGWDPKETWAFITWVFYAAYLHAQATTGWRGTKAGWLAVGGYAAFLFNFFGVNIWLPGLHSYAGV